VHPLTGRRARALLRDSLGHLGLAVATVPVGLLVHRRGWARSRQVVLALSAVPPLLATVLAARADAGAGTAGHRRQGLVVLDAAGRPPGLARALVRNAVKTGLPWQLGHVVAVGASRGGFEDRDRATLVATALVHPHLVVAALAATVGSGRALHDRVAGTRLVARG
jgi:uncharacterized RDD family membrane protein YckC